MKNTIIKAFALLLVIVMTLSLAACGKSREPSVTTAAPEATTQPAGTTVPETTTVPEVTEPPVTDAPVVTEPPATEPPVTEPPVTEPLVTEPPVTEPPVTEPPVTEPPVTEPPATEAPAVENVFYNPNNNYADLNAIVIRPGYVYYKDGKLVAECFVVNGYNHTVYNIDVKYLAFGDANGNLICEAAFGVMENAVIAPNSYITWTFTFSADCIANPNADLSSLQYRSSISNNY